MDKRFPDEGSSFYRENEAMPFTELSPEILLKRGFTFRFNHPKDNSISQMTNVINFELAKLKKDLESRGLPSDKEPRIVISNLDTLVKGSLQVGLETKLVKGQYNPASGQLIKTDEKIAVFQRFQLDKFITSTTPKQLKQDGFAFVNNFPLLAWGDNLENTHPDLAEPIHDEIKKVEDYVREQEFSGMRVQLVKGYYDENLNETDPGVQGVAIFIKRK